MNDLGADLAWIAVQVAILTVPCLVAQALASRRGPSSGAWVATLSLGLVVLMNLHGLIVLTGWRGASAMNRPPSSPPGVASVESAVTRSRPVTVADGPSSTGTAWDLSTLRQAWSRLGRGAATPVEKCRPWGAALAAGALAGTALGLIRLAAGVHAIRDCRRRSWAIDEPGMLRLLTDLRQAMSCPLAVELRQTAELSTPATAGWRRPWIFLPEDWRSWDDIERRAVLAHELAHIRRGDYPVGLLARFALALNFHQPLLYRVAGRLRLQQEQAADALAAQFAGGRATYLVALATLALKQDGPIPCWPLRTFLPGRGILIRRIAMLRDQNESRASDQPLSRTWRAVTAGSLLSLTFGVTALRGPTRAVAGAPTAEAPASVPAALTAIEVPYIRNGMDGIVAIRPASIHRHAGTQLADRDLLSDGLGMDLADLAKILKVDSAAPGFRKLHWEEIEWVAANVLFGRGRNAQSNNLHSIEFGSLTVRAVGPFDWPAFLRQWNFGLEEVREGGRTFYRIVDPMKDLIPPDSCVYILDERTAVFDREKEIRALAGGKVAPLPDYLRGPDWERASRGLLAVAVGNRDGAFAKSFDLGRPEDAVVLTLFQGLDRWTLGVADADPIALHAVGDCLGDDSAAAITGAMLSLLKQGQQGLEHPDPKYLAMKGHQRAHDMAKALLTNLDVRSSGHRVEIRGTDFGTLADFATYLHDEAEEAKARVPDSKEQGRKPQK